MNIKAIGSFFSRLKELAWFNIAGSVSIILLVILADHYEGMKEEYLYLLSFKLSKSILVDLLTHLAAATFIGIIVTNFLKRFNEKDLIKNLDDLKREIEIAYPKVQYVAVDIGLFYANRHLKKIDREKGHVYAVGIGKSEVYNKYSIIQEYYKMTERILKESDSQVIYKRITASDITHDKFITHLANCLDSNCQDQDIRVKVLLSDNRFVVSETFLIIEDKFLFISPTSPDGDDKRIIGGNCFITEDAEVIEQYTNHFNDLWETGKKNVKVITSKAIFLETLNDRKLN